jgi:SAM-dependent methyltransferase
MLHEARRRTGDTTVRVEFRSGDISRLDFDDAAFDGVTCERVFQHLDTPDAALAELVRVTRPGGRIVVIDTDWGMHAIHGADPGLTSRVVECWASNAATGWSGRRLPGLFVDAGMRAPVVVAETFTCTDGRRRRLSPPWPRPPNELARSAPATLEAGWLSSRRPGRVGSSSGR